MVAVLYPVSGNVIGKELERYEATEFDVLGLVDHTHPATASFSTMQ